MARNNMTYLHVKPDKAQIAKQVEALQQLAVELAGLQSDYLFLGWGAGAYALNRALVPLHEALDTLIRLYNDSGR